MYLKVHFLIFCNSKLQAILPIAEILEAMEMDMILFVLLQTTLTTNIVVRGQKSMETELLAENRLTPLSIHGTLH